MKFYLIYEREYLSYKSEKLISTEPKIRNLKKKLLQLLKFEKLISYLFKLKK